MDFFKMLFSGKTVFLTGASSGIGEACARHFAAIGARLILCARRLSRLESLAATLQTLHKTETLVLQLDVRDREAVRRVVTNLPPEWRSIDLLINNAGLALGKEPLQVGDITQWETMIDTNIKGLLYVTRALLPGMLEKKRGHIINVGSIAGQECYPHGNVYAATKYAVRAITKSLRLDLLGTPIRVSEIAPGAVETEFSTVRWNDAERARAFYSEFTPLSADDIAETAVWMATRPAHVNIAEVTILPTAQASANHLHRG
ncbi:SDR family NAD(P)-dependent oxidoreductase [Legionella geestiana]|nr:SDR family NAD(P)-dependent oxidoreductase [Legionella geestiana]QDQ40979.1 SDR family NAD(P)-dependent oxidoreductase [Legionella geestiana]